MWTNSGVCLEAVLVAIPFILPSSTTSGAWTIPDVTSTTSSGWVWCACFVHVLLRHLSYLIYCCISYCQHTYCYGPACFLLLRSAFGIFWPDYHTLMLLGWTLLSSALGFNMTFMIITTFTVSMDVRELCEAESTFAAC